MDCIAVVARHRGAGAARRLGWVSRCGSDEHLRTDGRRATAIQAHRSGHVGPESKHRRPVAARVAFGAARWTTRDFRGCERRSRGCESRDRRAISRGAYRRARRDARRDLRCPRAAIAIDETTGGGRMTWLAQVRHVAWKDVRESRWVLSVYAVTVLAATARAIAF